MYRSSFIRFFGPFTKNYIFVPDAGTKGAEKMNETSETELAAMLRLLLRSLHAGSTEREIAENAARETLKKYDMKALGMDE